jgi:eukaryotic-like serine/threonine-protein kinase
MSSPVNVGDILAGKYQVERVLGVGGMGVVVSARHLTLGERVAIKFLLPQALARDDVKARFLQEAKAAARLRGEHVARVHDTGMLDSGAPYMVMEYLEGSDLGAVLRDKGPMSVADAVDYVVQACEALAEAHSAGIIHRDLKPSNLFVIKRLDGSPSIKLIDFGISKVQLPGAEGAEGEMTATAVMMGSPLYMAPEQMASARDVDGRSDIWSLGVILYELLAGEPPFGGSATAAAVAIATDPIPPLSLKRPDVPAGLEAAIERALSKEPQDRFADVASFAAALAPFAPQRGAWPSEPDLPVAASLDLGRSVLASGHDLSEWSPATERAETLSAAALRSAETLPAPSFLPRLRVRTLALAASGALVLGLGVRASVHSPPRVTEPDVATAAGTDESSGSTLTAATQPPAFATDAFMADTQRIDAADAIPPPAMAKHVPLAHSAAAMASVPAPTQVPAPPLVKARPRPGANASLNHPLYIP